jgi:epoxyqueuosine reductase
MEQAMTSVEEGFKFLENSGLNLISVMNCAELPKRTTKFMAGSGIPVADYRQLVLIGHGGKRMWESLQVSGMETTDPVDRYAVYLTQQFIRNCLNSSPVLWLYPNSRYAVPLQQLGESAGWSFPSPLGSGISPEYGVWFAYRAAFLVDTNLPLTSTAPTTSPCGKCVEKPCVYSCPAGAVQTESFELEICAHYRLSLRSSCADRCLARLSCPAHTEHRYTLDQTQYHYRHSLATLRNWYGE